MGARAGTRLASRRASTARWLHAAVPRTAASAAHNPRTHLSPIAGIRLYRTSTAELPVTSATLPSSFMPGSVLPARGNTTATGPGRLLTARDVDRFEGGHAAVVGEE